MEKPDVYKVGEGWYYRASSLGGCKRALVALRQGFESVDTPDWIKGTYDAGKAAEPVAINMLRDRGWRVYDEQLEFRFSIAENVFVIGHVDGLGENSYEVDGTVVIEVKSQSALEFAKGINWGVGLWPKYRWQASVYSVALRTPLVIARYNRDTGELVTEPFDCAYTLEQIVDRVNSVEEAGALPVTCSSRNHPCPVYYLCEGTGEVLPANVNEVILREYAKVYKDAEVQEKYYAAEKLAARAKMREVVGKGKHVLGDGTVINFYDQRNPKQVDWAAIENRYPEFKKADYMRDGEVSERLRVSFPDSEDV